MKKIPINEKKRSLRRAVFNTAWPMALLFSASLTAPMEAHAINQVFPLDNTVVPDVNELGLLDKSGTGANNAAWPQITISGKKLALKQLGKALFWDMQVGGDGVQACASCHFHAGADNRKINQMSPGFKMGDNVHDFGGPNHPLTVSNFLNPNQFGTTDGLPSNELFNTGSNDLADGTPGIPGAKADPANDQNDVVSSQGPRSAAFDGISGTRSDFGVLDASDDIAEIGGTCPGNPAGVGCGFNKNFSANETGIPDTVRRVEPRNSPTILNAVYNLRNFWDGRADAFFNGVNPLGFRDPHAMVKVYQGGTSLGEERLKIPFSSLASQAVGPTGSTFEMVGHDPSGAGRPSKDLGHKLAIAQPLKGQLVACNDSLLGSLTDCSVGDINRGLINKAQLNAGTYAGMIKQIFHQRFWGDGSGNDVCLDENGNYLGVSTDCYGNTDSGAGQVIGVVGTKYTLLEWNFTLFFGLAVQAYEATQFTEKTPVDILAGDVTGTVTNGLTGRNLRSIVVNNLPIEACIAGLQRNNNAAEVALATDRCYRHYAKFIHPKARTGSESAAAPFGVGGLANGPGVQPIPANAPIGGCINPTTCTASPNVANAIGALKNIDRGAGRFFAGATGCSICHLNAETTGATVSTLTGFGIPPADPLPPGQARRLELRALMERMIAFNGAAAVYDSGFYNLGVRPTPEDISLGDQIGGVPLAFSKLKEVLDNPNNAAVNTTGLKVDEINLVSQILASLQIPTSAVANAAISEPPTVTANLAPVPFNFNLACGVGLNGNGGANGNPNNNPNNQCITTVIAGERLLRNGAFKASSLRNVKFTGPFMHNGSKMNVRQVVEFYKTAGHFSTKNFNNLDAGMRIFQLGAADEAALVELLETGWSDFRVAHEEGKFDHPELCVPHGHDSVTGKTRLVGIPAVGASGHTQPIQTFQEQLAGDTTHEHALNDPCTVNDGGVDIATKIEPLLSNIDVPAPAP